MSKPKRRNRDVAGTLERMNEELKAGNYTRALSLAEELRKQTPAEPKYVFLSSYCLMMLGRAKEGERLLRRGLQRFPDDAGILIGLGMILVAQHRPGQAEGYLRKALDLAPPERHAQRAQAFTTLGEALWQLFRREEAIKVWKEALREDPDHPGAIQHLKTHLNEYGEPKARDRVADDFFHFLNIHTQRYLSLRGQQQFESLKEASNIHATIQRAWNNLVASQGKQLDTMTAAEKTALFTSVSIDFNRPPPPSAKIIPLTHTLQQDEEKDQEALLQQELTAMLDNALPFLPAGTSGLVILLGMPALSAAGLSWHRLKSFLNGKANATAAEVELFEWALEVVLAVVNATHLRNEVDSPSSSDEAEEDDDPAHALLDAVEVAAQRLPLKHALLVVREIYDLAVGGFPTLR